jgi:8-oxo-dGTP pyrophosphatase MutT (NUDIX family)
MSELKNWEYLGETTNMQTPVFDVVTLNCLSPKDGKAKNFFCLKAPQWVNILPITTDGQVVLVNQYRQGTRLFSLELPGGVVEPGQSLIETARRELMEETGYSASDFSLLCSLKPNPALFGNTIHTYLATGAEKTGTTDFDENEDLEMSLAPVEELPNMILDGRIDHALMVAAIGFYFAKIRKQTAGS